MCLIIEEPPSFGIAFVFVFTFVLDCADNCSVMTLARIVPRNRGKYPPHHHHQPPTKIWYWTHGGISVVMAYLSKLIEIYQKIICTWLNLAVIIYWLCGDFRLCLWFGVS